MLKTRTNATNSPKEPLVKNGEINKLFEDDKAAHRWYRFVLSYPPHLVRRYVEEFGMSKNHCVLDPFCGTGTTVVECKKLGIPSIGVEANKMAFYASTVKVDWNVRSNMLKQLADRIADQTLEAFSRDHIDDDSTFFRTEEPILPKYYRRLSEEQQKLILKDSISPLPLHKALLLLEIIEQHKRSRYYSHMRLALAKAVVFTSSNLHFGPEVGVRTPKRDSPVVAPWLAAMDEIVEDVKELSGKPSAPVDLYWADARDINQHVSPNSVDAVITSPPYPNEKDYTRTTRLESVLLNFIQNKADLRAMKHDLIRSNTRNVYKGDDDDVWIQDHKSINRIAEKIEKRRVELGKTSGFERLYAKVTKLYFGGMARHLAQLKGILRPGAHLAYVVGDQASYLRVMIRTGELLAEIAEALGYEVVRIDLFRTRIATVTKEMMREEVLVLRWPGRRKYIRSIT
ncbi:MAG: hypothetical protein JW810_00745 [Sedimentisphaerales bacterium]|nr:hypothetical protein [Sedimentisphaerales bacterium]